MGRSTVAVVLAVTALGALGLAGCRSGGDAALPWAHPASSASAPPTSHRAAGFAPRLDGLYVSEPSDNERDFVRFAPGGSAYEAGVIATATADDVRRWLKPGGEQSADDGPWPCGPDGSFTSRSSAGTVDFTVLNFRGDTFDLHSVSHINGYVGTEHMTFSPDHP